MLNTNLVQLNYPAEKNSRKKTRYCEVFVMYFQE